MHTCRDILKCKDIRKISKLKTNRRIKKYILNHTSPLLSE